MSNESLTVNDDVLIDVDVPRTVKLPVTERFSVISTEPLIVPPDELNLVFELSNAPCANMVAVLA